MNFAVTDFKKKKEKEKSIKWQILKCHDFSGCSVQKTIWKCQYPSPHQPCEPGRPLRLWWIPGWIPVGFSFLRAQSHVGTPALPPSPSGIWGSARSTLLVRGFFWQFCWWPDPPMLLARVTHQPGVPWEQPAQPGSGGQRKARISNDFLTNSAAHCLFSFINCSTPAI